MKISGAVNIPGTGKTGRSIRTGGLRARFRDGFHAAVGIVLFCFCLSGITACEKQEAQPEGLIHIYYVSVPETKVETREYVMQSDTLEGQLEEVLERLSAIPEKLAYKAPLNMGFSLLAYTLENGKIRLEVDGRYKGLPPTTEVLARAAIVLTLTQIKGINFVGFTVEGNPLYDNLDNVVGWMNADQFRNNAGSEINTYEKVHLKLYFANESGTALVAENRTKLYNSNISLEKLVVEELIKGPGRDGIYPAIHPDTRIISVMTKDGICYVSLDDAFLTPAGNATADVVIYSIVDSLAELSSINKVQITINGNSSGVFREKYSFGTVFERNLDLVEAPEH
ncbi:MAG: GerMN domain-containing protein [Clostridium sp.]|nr:GerMN domain-containing protein [Clostridium sp.]